MNKIFVIFLALSVNGVTQASYLDDWSNDNLCGWMSSASAPQHIQDEVRKRKILCFGGKEVESVPDLTTQFTKNGTVFPSPDPSLLPEATNDNDVGYSY